MSDFNINKCNINVKGHQCKNNVTSGCMLVVNGDLIKVCTTHYKTYKNNMENAPVYHFTNIKPVQEDTTMNINHLTIDQVKLIKPFIDFEKLNTKANELYATTYKNRMGIMGELSLSVHDPSKVGDVYNASVYVGYVGHDSTTYVMVFDAMFRKTNPIIIPMSEFKIVNQTNNNKEEEKTMKQVTGKGILCGKCHQYHQSTGEVAMCHDVTPVKTGRIIINLWDRHDGTKMQDLWRKDFNSARDHAKELETKGGVKAEDIKVHRAHNGNGWWVTYPTHPNS